MEPGLADVVLPVLASIGASTLWRAGAPVPAPAVVFCDCPSVAFWFLGGVSVGFLLGLLVLSVFAAFLRPLAGPAWRTQVSEAPVELFVDAAETLEPPTAAYRQ